MSEIIIKTPVRISYPTVWNPKEDMQGRQKYSCDLLIPKGETAILAEINAAIQSEVQAKWGAKAPAKPQIPIHDGDGTKPRGSAWPDEYKGHWVLRTSANADHPPMLWDQYHNDLRKDPQGSGKIYGGCYCFAVLRFWAYDQQGNKGIGCGLSQLMFAKDGEAFGGGQSDPDALAGLAQDNSTAFYPADANPFGGFIN